MKKFLLTALAALAIALLTACSGNGQLSYIGDEAARTAALSGAGLSADSVTFTGTKLTNRDGVEYYLVSFTSGANQYQSQVDALSGVVIQTETQPLSQSAATAASGATITAEDAKAKALAHAGLTADAVTFVTAQLDRDDGRLVYDVEFYTADYKEYDYEIDAATGAVVSYDYDAEGYAPPAATSGTISADDAKAIALAQVPGASASDIWEFETDRDDGRIQYEGKIVYGGMEYEFEIDGYSGTIRNWEVEPAHH